MQISQFLSEYAPKSFKKEVSMRESRIPTQSGTRFSDNDRVEISSNSNLNAERLQLLKSRVQSGFYFTGAVTDDLSEKMSNLMDPLTDA